MKARGFGIAIVTLLSYASLVFSSSSQSTSRHPSGILTGRVVDDEGRPMRGAQVQALIFGYQNGSREALPRGNTATTNDRGEFRIFWLETGMYYLVVHPNATSDPLSLLSTRTGLAYTPSDPDATFVTTYFPGTPDSRKPESIQVGPGELDVHAIQVAALPTRLIRIRIVNPKLIENTNYFAYFPLVTLRSVVDSPLVSAYPVMPRALGNGEFEMRAGLAPGQYRLLLVVRSPSASYAGTATLTVDQGDPNIIEVPVSRTISVQGQVVMQGSLSSLRVIAIPNASQASGIPVSSEVRPNGNFVLEGVLPGAYTIGVDGADNDAYLAAVSLQGEEVSSSTVALTADVESLKLTLRLKQGGSIRGVVIDETRTAQANVNVMLVPDIEHRSRLDLLRFAITNNQGEFQIHGIAPGNYRALAVQEIQGEGEAFRDPALLERLSAGGTPVTISSGARLNLGLIQILKP